MGQDKRADEWEFALWVFAPGCLTGALLQAITEASKSYSGWALTTLTSAGKLHSKAWTGQEVPGYHWWQIPVTDTERSHKECCAAYWRWRVGTALARVAMRLWGSVLNKEVVGQWTRLWLWTTDQLTLASLGILLEEFHGSRPCREEGPRGVSQ